MRAMLFISMKNPGAICLREQNAGHRFVALIQVTIKSHNKNPTGNLHNHDPEFDKSLE